MTYFGQYIQMQLTTHGYSREDLGRLLGLGGATVKGWLTDDVFPRTDNLVKLVRLFGPEVLAMYNRDILTRAKKGDSNECSN